MSSPNGLIDMNPDIRRLRQLVANIANDHVSYLMDAGTCDGHGIFENAHVAAQDATMTAGAIFPRHGHHEYECLVVYRGKIQVTADGVTTIIEEPGVISFSPEVQHTITALTAARMIAISIPATAGYPYARTPGG